jgi:hypothetical protein
MIFNTGQMNLMQARLYANAGQIISLKILRVTNWSKIAIQKSFKSHVILSIPDQLTKF